jgi:two-component system, OmpR family, response regulator
MSPAARTSFGQTGSTPPERPLRVVVVDDNRDIVLTMTALLREEGHETKACYSGEPVLDCVIAFEADVVLLDIGLPGISGWEVARQIRTRIPGKRPMIIGLSGQFTQGADRVLAEISGFDHYLVKPADPAVLLGLLGQARPSE